MSDEKAVDIPVYHPDWERVTKSTERMKIYGGWLVRVFRGGISIALTFVPDPFHEWKIA